MARLIYSAIASLDGYVNDEDGRFDWSAPDEEVHAFVNDEERAVGTYLYGRRMYDVMAVWETWPSDDRSASRYYADIWRAAAFAASDHARKMTGATVNVSCGALLD